MPPPSIASVPEIGSLAAVLIGVVVGSIAGYFGGRTDEAMMRVTELFQTIPGFILAILLVATLGPTIGHVIVAIGIVPNTENIGLEALGVATDRGHIKVDGFGRTNVEGIYAIGDVAGLPALFDAMRARGYDEPLIRAVACDNWLRVLEQTWGA